MHVNSLKNNKNNLVGQYVELTSQGLLLYFIFLPLDDRKKNLLILFSDLSLFCLICLQIQICPICALSLLGP